MLRKYSQRTIKLYSYHNREFLEFSNEMSNEDIRDYLYHLANEKEASTSTLNTAINALKFYYGKVLKRRFVYEIVAGGFESGGSLSDSFVREQLKHKAILMLIYSAG
ncbi:hypothetical protein DRN97_09275 [Methanosarcinales archaeon]|nr:MAG: hypothetical protein DRN97_09275 [Methanosarcinales archaeon]